MDLSPTELIGYAGSAFIIVSLTQKSIVKLRVFGLAGSLIFLVYTIVIQAYPIAVVNVIVAIIHVTFLRRLLSKKIELFTKLEVAKESQYLLRFLEFHADDIAAHQSAFSYEPRDDQVRVFILRDMAMAGVFIGRVCGDRSVEVELDYVIPQYRDHKVASFLYSARSSVFSDQRGRTIWTRPGTEKHNEYFKGIGFAMATAEGEPALVADLDSLVGVG